MMEASQDHDVVVLDQEEERIREATEDSLPDLTVNLGKSPREADDSGGRRIHGS